MDLMKMLKALADPTRLKIVEMLLDKHHCSRSLAQSLDVSEAAISQHMAVLKSSELVIARRHGRHLHFALNPQAFCELSSVLADATERIDAVVDCHVHNPCSFHIEGDVSGCLYQDSSCIESDARRAYEEGDPMRIAIPSETDQCLSSERSGHFGHAPYFTIVTIQDGAIISAEAVKNVDHGEFGCGGVIDYVLGLGIDAMLTVGMGRPPFMRFTNAGISVYSERETPMVGEVAEKFARGECQLMDPETACKH
jgi:predicted Fe-Mo cluster-binding NifX family protein/DNA-binding transcriptional ArsR family regulator